MMAPWHGEADEPIRASDALGALSNEEIALIIAEEIARIAGEAVRVAILRARGRVD